MENIVYYLALFVLVFIIRYFKLKKEHKLKFTEHKLELLHVSLELIYTASGIVIALLLNIEKKWIPAVIIIYVIFVITSSLLEMVNRDDFSKNMITIYHGILVCLIIFFSILTYLNLIPNVDINGKKTVTKTHVNYKIKYAVIIPYTDESLLRNAGKSNLNDRKFLFYNELTENNLDSIRKVTIAKLKNTIKPLYKESNLTIEIDEENIKLFKIER